MAFYRLGEPDYYEQRPEWMRRREGRDNALFVLGDADDRSAPVTIVREIAPGATTHRHGHGCERLEIVIKGSLVTDDGVVLGPGDVMRVAANELYGPQTAGPDGCVTAEFFSEASGVHHLVTAPDSEVSAAELLQS